MYNVTLVVIVSIIFMNIRIMFTQLSVHNRPDIQYKTILYLFRHNWTVQQLPNNGSQENSKNNTDELYPYLKTYFQGFPKAMVSISSLESLCNFHLEPEKACHLIQEDGIEENVGT